MKILIYTDNHFCEQFSIITKMGDKYSQRLENQIKSLNWVEDLARKNNCDMVICAGDFFDKPNLTQQEITALNEINWYPQAEHYFLVGNHESEENDLHYNSAEVLAGDREGFWTISKPYYEGGWKDFELAFLPYIKESMKQELSEYFPPKKPGVRRLLISHNDLFGIQMGPTISALGFKPEDLAAICDYCVNGHLHNGTKVNNKVINLGNLTGKDFGEDAFRYKHNVMLFDTDAFTYELIPNPYAFNFYTVEINTEADLKILDKVDDNAVVKAKCRADLVPQLREAFEKNSKIIETRIFITRELSSTETEGDLTDLTVDENAKFVECCKAKLENTKILDEELAEVLK